MIPLAMLHPLSTLRPSQRGLVLQGLATSSLHVSICAVPHLYPREHEPVTDAVSCAQVAPHGTLLTSAMVTAYCTFLCYSALASYPKGECNPMAGGGGWDVVLAVLFAAVSMASTAFSATSAVAGTQALVGRSESSTAELEKPLDAEANSSSEEEEGIEPASYWHYHVMMAMCSLYMAMLLTNWSNLPADMVGVPSHQVEDVNMQSFWVKIVSQWLCFLIYGWTLLAPYLMRNHRDFGIDFSDFD